ncbi:YdeI/OmpD-associated family protein [Saccharibacillus endophyticus]|uniref:YdhG-like domain-containing protein n=1 Tax=Saccharibacillus endophyticus TaxID=2060666 RepID=A0ABQ1ZXE0_9BACL|nr:DUF1801 domain-containing protein [Saccharibacillus endophyticus]GGH79609.1 hypothetical protein GCM10007362_26660 [Saccharibacillus endophyticus]
MTQHPSNPKVDAFMERSEQWKAEFVKLRSLALASGAVEELKWGQPCYTIEGRNVFLIHGFKEYCAILFMKGALMQDDEGLLVQQTQKVQAARQLRFASADEIEAKCEQIAAYLSDAIEVEKAGLKVEMKPVEQYSAPQELEERFESDPILKEAFEALTPGRQRAYLMHFIEPKQSKTREARIDKHAPRILEGKGLTDR